MRRTLGVAAVGALLTLAATPRAQEAAPTPRTPTPPEAEAEGAAPDPEAAAPATVEDPPPAEGAEAPPADAAPTTPPSAAAPPTDDASTEEAAPPATDAADDAEVAALLADEATSLAIESYASTAPRLDLYGFMDFTYLKLLMPDESPYYVYLEEHGSFFVGNFNLYLDGQLADRWRTLAEVRFLYLPNGTTSGLTPEGEVRTDTSVGDYADVNRSLQWGGIEIERAWLEFQAHSLVTIRVGQYLTPYGIWNVDHGSPVYIGTRRPYIVGQQLFPERQTGIQLYSELPVGPASLGYHLTLSNGRGPSDEFRDLDENKALGGRLYLKLTGKLDLTVGASAYHGSYTDKENTFNLLSPSELERVTNVFSKYDETALSADVRLDWEGLLFQSEVAHNQRAYDDAGRPAVSGGLGGTPGLAADGVDWGAYAMAGYRIRPIDLMPYVYYEYIDFGAGLLPDIQSVQVGLNYHPVPPVVLKGQFTYAASPAADSLFEGEPITAIETQIAWAF